MTNSANASGDSSAAPLTLDAAARVAASAEELAGALRRSGTISRYPEKLGRYEVQRCWHRFVSAIEATPRRIVTEPADGGWPPLSAANLLHVMCRCRDEVRHWLDQKTSDEPPIDVIDSLDRTANELRSLVKAHTEKGQPPDREKGPLPTTPVTLREFMREYCEPLKKNLLNGRLRSLGSANRRGRVRLPDHVGNWTRGQSKTYPLSDLMSAWPEFCDQLSGLPRLRDK